MTMPSTQSSKKLSKAENLFKNEFLHHSVQSEIKKLPIRDLEKTIALHYSKINTLKKDPFSVSVSTVTHGQHAHEIIGQTQIDVIAHDMAFIVDSVTAKLVSQGLNIVFLVHPLIEKVKPTKTHTHRAHLHIRISNLLPREECQKLKEALEIVLDDIVLATNDWEIMKDRVRTCQKGLNNAPNTVYAEDLIEDNLEFLEYLYRSNFTLLGYREYKFTPQQDGSLKSVLVRKSSLGLLRNERLPIFLNHKEISLPAHLQKLRADLPPVYVSKINKLSTVHRQVPLDCINIKLFDEEGQISGEGCFIGLFTSMTYNQSLQAVPFLRYKAAQVMQKSGFVHGSHNYRVLQHVLEKYPRDELFQIQIDQLCAFSRELVKLQDYKRLTLFMRNDPFERFVSCLIYVPKERWDTRLRLKFKNILEHTLQGETIDYTLSIDDSPLARLSFVISVEPFHLVHYNHDAIEQDLRVAAQSWVDQLQNTIYEETGSDKTAYTLVQKYGEAFSGRYQDRYTTLESFKDILKIEEVFDHNSLSLDLTREENTCDESGQTCHLHLKFYNADTPIDLSALFPIIETMGFYVTSEIPSDARLDKDTTVWIHDFQLQTTGIMLDKTNFETKKKLFEETFLDIYTGKSENDFLNQLSLKEGLSGRDIVILRTALRYLRQTIYTYSKSFTEQVVVQNSKIAALLVALFKTHHDPDFAGDRLKSAQKITNKIKKEFWAVKSIDHDQIMRLFWNVIEATLRTNFFQKDENGVDKEYISIKLKSADIPSLPDPKPYREIFVYSRRIEGVHLRGGAISRGGLRWSDRHEDFRTEVLGLMKAQMVKNAVIVPMGAKGGFIVKSPPPSGDRQEILNEGIACYKIFIQALLDITDNMDTQKVIPPRDVVRRDDNDPYLVVAADKGTATFSDIANGLSQAHGFWLDDAFASGGSAGYDHKIMGITARGAWESVKRHFRELDHDTQSQDFDVIGIGDMGGDVFGNGMLLSKHIRLIGAFNHLHIFCDPDPDPAQSWTERNRLFKGVKGWDHYNTKLLSKGGRIYSREDKTLKLTPQIKARFGIESNDLSPFELMKYILKSQTDLLWFGGIGTYIKASSETHADASDKANNVIRINANEVQARVIGEGANLGVTQCARIEYAQLDGKVNADFIDNAGGVDSSDHEVNIKILLNPLTKGKKPRLTLKARNKLLEEMTQDVERLVLRNNYQQSQAISLMRSQAPMTLLSHADYMCSLENKNILDRTLEFLPHDEDINERLKDGEGLYSPELCVLQCYAKNTMTKEMLTTSIPDHPVVQDVLLNYFPDILIKKYEKEILAHPLRREIIATQLSNILVNRFGPSFIADIMAQTGTSFETVLKAYLVITKGFDLRTLWRKIELLDTKINPHVQIKALGDISKIIERQVTWLAKRLGTRIDVTRKIPIFKKAVKNLRKDLIPILPDSRLTRLNDSIASYVEGGIPEDIARDIAYMSPMSAIGNIIMIAENRKIPIQDMAHVYYAVGEYFHIYWLRLQSRHLFAPGIWSGQALREIRNKLYICQAKIAERYITDFSGKHIQITPALIDEWCNTHALRSKQFLSTIRTMRDSQQIDLSMLIVAEQMLGGLYEG